MYQEEIYGENVLFWIRRDEVQLSLAKRELIVVVLGCPGLSIEYVDFSHYLSELLYGDIVIYSHPESFSTFLEKMAAIYTDIHCLCHSIGSYMMLDCYKKVPRKIQDTIRTVGLLCPVISQFSPAKYYETIITVAPIISTVLCFFIRHTNLLNMCFPSSLSKLHMITGKMAENTASMARSQLKMLKDIPTKEQFHESLGNKIFAVYPSADPYVTRNARVEFATSLLSILPKKKKKTTKNIIISRKITLWQEIKSHHDKYIFSDKFRKRHRNMGQFLLSWVKDYMWPLISSIIRRVKSFMYQFTHYFYNKQSPSYVSPLSLPGDLSLSEIKLLEIERIAVFDYLRHCFVINDYETKLLAFLSAKFVNNRTLSLSQCAKEFEIYDSKSLK